MVEKTGRSNKVVNRILTTRAVKCPMKYILVDVMEYCNGCRFCRGFVKDLGGRFSEVFCDYSPENMRRRDENGKG